MREKKGGHGNGQGGDNRKVGTRRQHRGEYVCVRASIYLEDFEGSGSYTYVGVTGHDMMCQSAKM